MSPFHAETGNINIMHAEIDPSVLAHIDSVWIAAHRMLRVSLLGCPPLHFFPRHVFDVSSHVPGMAKRIFKTARPVSIELILHRTNQFCPGGDRTRHETVDVLNIEHDRDGCAP